MASYDDEQHARASANLYVPAPNASKVRCIRKLLLNNHTFNDCTVLHHLMTALIGLLRTGGTILSLISATYCILDDNGTYVFSFETLRP